MPGVGEEGADGGLLHHAAAVHDGDVVGDLGDHAHVVGDEQHREAVLGLEPGDEAQDLGLGGDVECGGGFVGDEDAGVAGERHGDHGALAHAAAELERVAADGAFGVGDLHLAQQVDGAGVGFARGGEAVGHQAFADLPADAVQGRQGGHRLLEHHGDTAAAHLAHGGTLGRQAREVDRLCVRAGPV